MYHQYSVRGQRDTTLPPGCSLMQSSKDLITRQILYARLHLKGADKIPWERQEKLRLDTLSSSLSHAVILNTLPVQQNRWLDTAIGEPLRITKL